ncbi:SapC protein [Novosphingobium kunmingense]|uniref:SapC protein n=1 Tax=Novosphingobium kunmingense TaxID=1211806 RepID=A0A2N0H6G5_9SPHN|nr:SapC family protein [Novosphingobium kunmingense]PKB14507.1 SapC protein [Novosphingobium kunmingense]
MTQHQILNPADHRDLRIRTEAGAELGDGEMAALAVPAEFRRLACEYPILFRHDAQAGTFSALALLGFEPGENLYLDGGKWDAAHRPLAMAIRPFLVGRPHEAAGASQVHIDMGHARIARDGEGVRVFDNNGAPTPYLDDIIGQLGALDEGFRASGAFFAALDRYDLLEPFSMDVTLDNGAEHRLVGYHLINEERLAALEPALLAELRDAGFLEAIYMAIASLGNLGKLVRRKNRRING